jgi:trehalose 6-phosphate phosphatase
MDKGLGVRKLLRESDVSAALYAGDDATDLDAFATLREMVEHGRLETAICVGVRSEEGPEEIVERADLVLDGPGEVRRLLEALLVE